MEGEKRNQSINNYFFSHLTDRTKVVIVLSDAIHPAEDKDSSSGCCLHWWKGVYVWTGHTTDAEVSIVASAVNSR